MLLKYWELRFKQLLRSLSEVGVIRGSFVLILAILSFIILLKLDIEYLSPALYLLILYISHSTRSDKDFLKITTFHPLFLYWSEYSIMSIPLMAVSIAHGYFTEIFMYIIGSVIAPFLFTIRIKVPQVSFPLFRKGSYEFQVMFRRNYFLFFTCYFVGLLGIYNGNERVFYVFAGLNGILFLPCFIDSEPLEYILVFKSPTALLKNKIGNTLYNTILLYMPFFVVGVLYGYSTLLIIGYIYTILLQVLVAFCSLKYCFLYNKLIMLLYGMFGIVPLAILSFLYPIVNILFLLINILLLFRATEKLNYYFRYD